MALVLSSIERGWNTSGFLLDFRKGAISARISGSWFSTFCHRIGKRFIISLLIFFFFKIIDFVHLSQLSSIISSFATLPCFFFGGNFLAGFSFPTHFRQRLLVFSTSRAPPLANLEKRANLLLHTVLVADRSGCNVRHIFFWSLYHLLQRYGRLSSILILIPAFVLE